MKEKHINQHLTCTSSFINGKYGCRHKLGNNTYLIENLCLQPYLPLINDDVHVKC